MKSVIYKITSKSKSNNRFYIGSSKNIEKRWKRHLSNLKNKNHANQHKGKTNKELFGEEKAKEISEKLSNLASERTGEKNPFYNKKHTKETKEKIGKANKGRKPNNRVKISIDDEIYDSYSDASKELNISPFTIRWRCLSANPKFINYKLI
jgi:uncharacterized protein (DUF4415 family)